jgi:hypothetical protein
MTKLLRIAETANRAEVYQAYNDNKIVRVSRGIYAQNNQYDLLEVLSLRYPKSIFTLDTMFSIYGMTDRFIDIYVLSMLRGSRTIQHERIRQIRQMEQIWLIGQTEVSYRGFIIRGYDKERLLIELFRFESTISKTLFKEVIEYYREDVKQSFRIPVFRQYCGYFRECAYLLDRFHKEVL